MMIWSLKIKIKIKIKIGKSCIKECITALSTRSLHYSLLIPAASSHVIFNRMNCWKLLWCLHEDGKWYSLDQIIFWQLFWIVEKQKELVQRGWCEVFHEDNQPKFGFFVNGGSTIRNVLSETKFRCKDFCDSAHTKGGSFILIPGQTWFLQEGGILYHIVFELGGCWVAECMGAIEHDDGRHLGKSQRPQLSFLWKFCPLPLFARFYDGSNRWDLIRSTKIKQWYNVAGMSWRQQNPFYKALFQQCCWDPNHNLWFPWSCICLFGWVCFKKCWDFHNPAKIYPVGCVGRGGELETVAFQISFFLSSTVYLVSYNFSKLCIFLYFVLHFSFLKSWRGEWVWEKWPLGIASCASSKGKGDKKPISILLLLIFLFLLFLYFSSFLFCKVEEGWVFVRNNGPLDLLFVQDPKRTRSQFATFHCLCSLLLGNNICQRDP